MHDAGIGDYIFRFLFSALLAAVVFNLVVMVSLPLRALLAFVRAPRTLSIFRQFFAQQTARPAMAARYVLSYGALISCLIVMLALWLDGQSIAAGSRAPSWLNTVNSVVNSDFLGYVVIAALFISIIGTGFSFAYEFYFSRLEKKILSADYARVFLYSLTVPYVFFFMFFIFIVPSMQKEAPVGLWFNRPVPAAQLGNMKDMIIYSSHFAISSEKAPVKVEVKTTKCSKFLKERGWHFSANNFAWRDARDKLLVRYNGRSYMPISSVINLVQINMVDNFLKSLTLDLGKNFGCHYSDVEHNGDNLSYSLLLMIMNYISSAFSFAIIALPLKRVLDVAYGALLRSLVLVRLGASSN